MKKTSTNTTFGKVKISDETRALYAQHDHSKDDPENPVLPPEIWERHGVIGKYYRPIKRQTTIRVDADVLDWLKSKGEGHLSRINSILRAAMIDEMHRRK